MERRKPLKRDGAGAKKFANARSTLGSRESLKRSEMRRSGALAPRSDKRRKHMAEERVPLVKALIEAGFGCEIGPVFAEAGIPNPDCSGHIQGMHERRKSGQGGSRTNRYNLVPACNSCNSLVETVGNDLLREVTGDALVVIEGDPEWERLGARHDREELEDALDIPIVRVVS